jgi:hydroxymethylbilane synthase
MVIVETTGDRTQAANVPIEAIGGRGVFVKEVEVAVLEGRADFAVHSAKDLPPVTAEGLELVGVAERGDARDVLIGCRLQDLASGAVVATGSVRRRAQLSSLRPDLTFANLRGNIDSRLAKASNFDAIVMAYAALLRLERKVAHVEVLPVSTLLPQVGQGALAVECRADDQRTQELLSFIDHRDTRLAVDAERAFLARLGGSCDLPVGAYATVAADGEIYLRALLASPDGHVVLRTRSSAKDPIELGVRCAEQLMYRDGGDELLADFGPQRV